MKMVTFRIYEDSGEVVHEADFETYDKDTDSGPYKLHTVPERIVAFLIEGIE